MKDLSDSAPNGQRYTHVPQEMHLESSILTVPSSFMVIAPILQAF